MPSSEYPVDGFTRAAGLAHIGICPQCWAERHPRPGYEIIGITHDCKKTILEWVSRTPDLEVLHA